MYKVLVTTNRGLEDVTKEEIKEILGVEAKERPFGILGRVLFEIKDPLKVAEFTYVTKTSNRVILMLKHFKTKRTKEGLDIIYKETKDIDWSEWLDQNQTFAVRTERMGVHEYTSVDINSVVGQAIVDSIKESKGYRQKVDLETPDVIIRVDVIGDDVFIGIDFVGPDSLLKRGYKVFNHPAGLKTTIANQMVRLSKWNKDRVLLDPMCGSGTIPIEAALNVTNTPGAYWRKDNLYFTKLKIFEGIDWDEWFEKIDEKRNLDVEVKGILGFDKNLRYVRGAEMNSIRAGVRKLIKWARIDLEWLDVKMQEKSVDVIITNPPYGIKSAPLEEAEKAHRLLFYQADWVLNDNGIVVLISAKPEFVERWAKYYKFEKIHERTVYHGTLECKIYIWKKSS